MTAPAAALSTSAPFVESPRLRRQLGLPGLLRCLNLVDLALDRREKLPALRKLPFDRCLLCRPLGDELRLLHMRVLQACLLFANRGLEDLDLLQDFRALVRDAVDRVDARHEVVERARTEQDLQAGVLAAGGVHRDEPRGERRLSVLEVRPGEAKLQLVLLKICLDRGQPLVGEVVRVDRMLEVRVEPLDLSEHGLSLCLLARNRSGGGKRRRGSRKG